MAKTSIQCVREGDTADAPIIEEQCTIVEGTINGIEKHDGILKTEKKGLAKGKVVSKKAVTVMLNTISGIVFAHGTRSNSED